MSSSHQVGYEKILLALAMAAATLSVAWGWSHRPDVRRLRALPVTLQPALAHYERADVRQLKTKPTIWAEPKGQTDGTAGPCEVFAAPVISRNSRAASFAGAPQQAEIEDRAPFGLELVEVRPEPFRVQLAGYLRGPGGYLAALVGPDSPGTMLAGEGHHFENLGLTLKRFTVEKVAVKHDDSWPVYDIAALAVLLDEQTGNEVMLDSRARKLTGMLLATFELVPEKVRTAELREGDTVSAGGLAYQIEHIQLDPAEVSLTRQTEAQGAPALRVLRMRKNTFPRVVGESATAGLKSISPSDGVAGEGQ